jgi:RNA polymerase sigma-70 factor, ECF subfamily
LSQSLGSLQSDYGRRETVRRVYGPELDDVVNQPPDDATPALVAKLAASAAKFAIFEVSRKVGRHLWQADGVHLDPGAWERMPDQFGLGPGKARARGGAAVGAGRGPTSPR